MGTSCGFSSFRLRTGGVGFMTLSGDCAWLITAWRFDDSLLVNCSSTSGCWYGFAVLFGRQNLMNDRGRFSISSSSKAKLQAYKSFHSAPRSYRWLALVQTHVLKLISPCRSPSFKFMSHKFDMFFHENILHVKQIINFLIQSKVDSALWLPSKEGIE